MPMKSKRKAKKSKRHPGIPAGCVRTDQVEISETSRALRVRPKCVVLSKESGGQVTWKHVNGKPFIVFFDHGTPFDDAIFYPGKEHSGSANSNAKYRKYEYTVKAGHRTLDPQVIIDK